MSADLTERLRRDSSGSVSSLDDRMRRASVQSVDSVRSDADWSALDAERAARMIARRVSLANVTRTRRQQEEEKGMGPEWTCETKNRRCRYATDHFLESDTVVGIFVLLVLIETAAVTGELMIERGFLSFQSCQSTCDGDKCGTAETPGYQLRSTDLSTYRVLHMTSVTILCMFEVEFMLMFYSIGFRCCCRKGAFFVILDWIIVTMALVAEVFYLATSTTSVLFVLVLRIIRILNGLIQQQVRNQEKQHRRIEAKTEELHERYDHQMRDMIMQSDDAAEQLVTWRTAAVDAVAMLNQAGIVGAPALPHVGRRAAQGELIDQGSVNPAMMRERVEFMRQVPMLKALSKDQLMRLAYDLTEQKFRPGDRLIIAGDEGDCMYIMEEGEAGAYIDGVGQVVAYGPGDFFGELALITRQKRGATIIANAPVLALVLDRKAFELVKATEAAAQLSLDREWASPPILAPADVSVDVETWLAAEDVDEDNDGLMRRRKTAVGFAVDAQVVVDGQISEEVVEEASSPQQTPPLQGESDRKR